MSFTVNLATIQDESAGIQTGGVATPLPGGGIEDNVGNDVDLALVTEPQIVADAVTVYGSATYGTARSGAGAITVAANTTALGFSGVGGAALPVDGIGGNTASSGLFTTAGEEIFLFTQAGNDNVVLGRDTTGDIAFVVILAETKAGSLITGAEFWMMQYQAIDHDAGGTGTAHDNLVDLANRLYVSAAVSTELLFDQFDGVSGQNQWLGFAPSSSTSPYSILLTGLEPTGTGNFDGDAVVEAHTINTSNAQTEDAIGSNSQSVVVGDGVRFEIVSNLDRTANTKNIDTTNYDSHLDLTSAGFKLVQTGGPATNQVDVQVSVYDTGDEDGAAFNDGIADDAGDLALIGSVKVFRGTSDGSTLPAGVSVTINGGVAQINNLLEGDRVVVYAADGTTFDRVLVVNNTNEGAANDTFDIGRFTATAGSTSQQVTEVGSFMDFADDGPQLTIAQTTTQVAHDETAGVDADANDTIAAGVVALFDTEVTNKSSDMEGYAQSAGAVVTATPTYGADGPGTVTFSLDISALGVNSGVQTTEGQSILLYKEGDLVVGRIGSQLGAAALAFSIDGTTGVLSVAQFHSLKHPTGGVSYDEGISLTDGVLRAVATATDSEDDVAIASTGIGDAVVFQDDGPFLQDPSNTIVSFAVNATATDSFTLIPGVDGQRLDVVGVPNVFSLLDGRTVTSAVYADASGNEAVRGTDSAGAAFYQITFDPAAGTDLGSYTLTMLQAPPPAVLNPLDFSALKAGGPQEYPVVEHIGFNGGTFTAGSGLFTSFVNPGAGTNSDDINPNNAGGIGIGNGNIDRLEVLVIDTTTSLSNVTGVQFVIQGVGGGIGVGDLLWEAVKDGSVVQSGSVLNVDLRGQAGPQTIDVKPSVDFDYLYVALDPNDFDSNDTARINKISTYEEVPQDDIVLGFRVNSDDGDGDQYPATYEEFSVTVQAAGTGVIDPGILGV